MSFFSLALLFVVSFAGGVGWCRVAVLRRRCCQIQKACRQLEDANEALFDDLINIRASHKRLSKQLVATSRGYITASGKLGQIVRYIQDGQPASEGGE